MGVKYNYVYKHSKSNHLLIIIDITAMLSMYEDTKGVIHQSKKNRQQYNTWSNEKGQKDKQLQCQKGFTILKGIVRGHKSKTDRQ